MGRMARKLATGEINLNLGQAFTTLFEDRDWITKLLTAFLLTFAGIAFSPFLVGLIPLAVMCGYMIEIATNTRDGKKMILPQWTNLTDLLTRGTGVLVALLIYNLPVLIVSCCLLLPGSVPDQLVGGLLYLTLFCCALPFYIIYTGFTWPLLAAGTARYLRSGQAASYFRFGELWDIALGVGAPSVSYVLCAIIVNGIVVLTGLTCIGVIFGAAILFPVHGHLLGQYAVLVEKRDKRKDDF